MNWRGGTCHPGSSWVQGAASQMNLAGADLDEEEHVQCFQAQGFDREEITGQQVVLVLAQKGTPGAALPGTQRSSRNSVPFEHSSDGRAPNTVAELEQLSFDFAVAVSGGSLWLSARSALHVRPQYAVFPPLAAGERSMYAALRRDASVALSRG